MMVWTRLRGIGRAEASGRNGIPDRARRRSRAGVFVHGLGTSELDLAPLAEAFAEVGFDCVTVTLEGHDGTVEALEHATVERWLEQVRAAVDGVAVDHDEVYLIGFSLGAALSLRVAAERKLEGLLCLSTFAKPAKPKFLVKLALIPRRLPLVGKRRPRVSARRTRKELKYTPKLPSATVSMVVEAVPGLSAIEADCPVLFVHSVDDPVASYKAVARAVKGAASDRVRLVTLSRLKHFIQFDIPTSALRDLALAHFHPHHDHPNDGSPIWTENVKQREDEVRHWANVLSLLFFGFFTVFGTLAKATLPDIANRDSSAPYLLFLYALLIAVYLQFAILNFFYMNRTQAYIRTYIDPVQEGGVGWTFYRTGRQISGHASGWMTRFVAASGTVLPMLAAIASIVYAVIEFHAQLFALEGGNLWLDVLAAVAVCWLLQVSYTALMLGRYTRTFLYLVPPVVPASPKFLAALREVYASADPGTVRSRMGQGLVPDRTTSWLKSVPDGLRGGDPQEIEPVG